ncbi:MAG: dipeptidase [Candidatus Eremiobacteraeota bacterium]|nr:dipeptidase [Candidatus Eremiobacteraeota bacterium]
MSKTIDTSLKAHCESNHDRYVQELTELVAIPSISADPQYAADVRRCAQEFVTRMGALGLQSEVLETDGHPVAYGEWLGAPGKPTIIVYGHYDVQPVDPVELWTSPPFEATVRDGKIFGRGTVDDKGQVLMHLAAIEAHFATRGALPINLKVVIEGEEEIGSPNFEKFLAKHAERLKCDLAVISDTAVFAEDVPSLTTSLRGLVHWEVRVDGPSGDLHSGYYGGVVRNPVEALCQMIAELKDADGSVLVPGFYDGVPELTNAERADLRTLRFDETQEAKALGVTQLAGESGRLPLERMWFRPTLECNGIWGGYQGPGAKTIIPSFAMAKLSARLVGKQDPTAVKVAVSKYLKSVAPAGVTVTVESNSDVRAVSTSRDHPAVKAAARAMEGGFGKAPVFIGTGGTIGPVSSFDRILSLPQVLIGVGLPDDAIHAPNEKFTLNQFFGGIKAIAHLYDELAEL